MYNFSSMLNTAFTGELNIPSNISITKPQPAPRIMATLTVAAHQWVSVWLDNEDINSIAISLEGINNAADIYEFNGLKDNDFGTWFKTYSHQFPTAILVIKNPEQINDLSHTLIECLKNTTDVDTLPALVFFDHVGLMSITGVVHEVYEFRAGKLEEIEVDW
jgi:hypothetical protein